MTNDITMAAYPVNLDGAKFHVTNGNGKIGNKYTLTYSTIPGAGVPTWADGRPITDVHGTCAGVCHACAKECYALASLRRYANSCAPAWAENTVIVRTDPGAVRRDILRKIERRRRPVKYVRFHVAGEFGPGLDGQNELLALVGLAYDVAARGVIVYGYTKRTDLLAWYEKEWGQLPENLIIMASQWRNADGVESVTNYTNAPEFHYDDGTHADLAEMVHCPAVDRRGRETGVTCEMCGMCQHARKGDKIAVYAH